MRCCDSCKNSRSMIECKNYTDWVIYMSNKKTAFVKQAAILAIAGLTARFIGFLYRLPLTELIGDVGNGIYGHSYYLYTFFLIISSAGLPAAISKMVSERYALGQYRNAHQVFRTALLVAGGAGLAGSLMLGLGADWFATYLRNPESRYSILALSPTVFIVAIMAVFRGYFQGMNNTVPTAISQVIEQIINAVFSVYLAYIFIGKGVAFQAAGGTAGTGIGAFAGLLVLVGIYFIVRPVLVRRANGDRNNTEYEKTGTLAIDIMRIALPIIAGTAIFSITNIIDAKMVLELLSTSGFSLTDALKKYGQLSGKYTSLTTLPVSISTALATAAVPTIAASVVLKDHAEVRRKLNTALRLAMIISIPAAVGIGVLGDQILRTLFPSNPGGGILLTVGAVSIIFLALYQIVTGMLQGIGKLRVPALAALAGGVVKILVNLLLIPIPSINVVGAVISTTACYVVASSINLYMLSKSTNTRPDFMGVFVKPLVASLFMGLGCYVFYYTIYYIIGSNTLALCFAIILGIFIYFISLFAFKGIVKEDLEMIPMGDKLINLMRRMGAEL